LQLLTAVNPESGTINYTYDSDGNVLTKVAPKPNQTGALTVTTTYAYDALHRLTQKSYNDGATATVKYGYDAVALSGCTTTPPTISPMLNPKGSRTAMCDASGATSWSYDPEGATLTEKRTLIGSSAITKTTSYTYNLDGSLATLVYPSARTVTYTPSAAGRTLSAVDVANSINYATNALYAPHGALSSLKNGFVSGGFAGITTTNSYNNRLQPVVLSAAHAGGTVLSFSYSFDQDPSPSVVKNNGDVVQIVNNRDTNRTQSFTYDELNRIATAQSQATSGTHCWGNSFAYDIWANLLSKTVTKCTAETLTVAVSTSNRITNSGFTYDAAGNMTNSGSGVMTYDAENRLVTVAGVTYTYDGDGKRVKKSSGKLYWTGTGSDALAETDLAGVIQSEFTFFGGKRVARRDGSGNTVFYYFSDHLGSASVVTNATGTIVEESDYYPFGGERVITNSDPNPYKFTGKERDGESGLDYFIARHYSSNLGRFLQPDEFAGGPVDAFSSNDPLPESPLPYADITNPKSLNKYTYTYNNPLRYTDPNGHDGWDVLLGAANALGSNFLAGAGRLEGGNSDFKNGQALGDAASVVGGLVETALGAGLEVGGLVLDATGVGAVVGVPANIVGAAAMVQGGAAAASGTYHLAQAANDKPGEVYVTQPQASGKPYVGRTTQGADKRMQTRSDGRTGKAKVVDKYKTKGEGRLKEQKQIDKRGGVKSLDNKRNEVDPKKMPELKKKVEGK
ncbi:MAG: RHS repeat-associated core domain-containing protein, partial [Terriglobales bacterium]